MPTRQRLLSSSQILSFVAAISLATWLPVSAAAAATSISGKVTAVTLYRGQAMVRRAISLDGPGGSREIVVSDLPEHVVGESLFAEGNDQVEVRAVRYRTRAVSEAPREEVRKLDEQIEQTNHQLHVIQKQKELLGKQLNYLDQLEGFVAPTAKIELSKGVLDAEALEKITRFSFQQREKLLDKQVANEVEAKELGRQLNLLKRKRAKLTDGSSRTVREAVIFLEKQGTAAESIRLNYLVSHCGWSPSYTLRADEKGQEVSVECNALIRQMTGENWDGVNLMLSTASPVLNADTPGLAPFAVTLVADVPRGAGGGQQAARADRARDSRAINKRKQAAIRSYNRAVLAEQKDGDQLSSAGKLLACGGYIANWEAIKAVNALQDLELGVQAAGLKSMVDVGQGADEGPSLVYRFDSPVSLASRADQQMVRILQTNLASVFHHIATPVLSGYVYREAEITNTGEVDLLAGPVTAYLDGQFVGRTRIPTVARGQTFVVGFGADPQLRARRELVDKSESLQGGNRELGFKYRLSVENSKDQAVNISIVDRMPYTDRPNDIRVTLGKMTDELSEDKLYVLREKSKGILRWDIEVPAGSAGADARLVEYGFTVDFDRKFRLTALREKAEQQQREFEELQRHRRLKR